MSVEKNKCFIQNIKEVYLCEWDKLILTEHFNLEYFYLENQGKKIR